VAGLFIQWLGWTIVSEAAASRISVLDTSCWTRVGGQIGSNPGGLYQDPQGVRWYLKTPSSDDHVRNEFLANRLYRLAGAEVADMALALHERRLAVASRVVKGLTLADLVGAAADKSRAAVCDHFATDAWLANRDVLGADLDNVLVGGRGLVMRIDQGGALRFRAQGSLKTDFGPEAIEFDTLRDPKRNAVAAGVFGAMDREQLLASLRRVAAIEAGAIRDTVLGVYGADADRLADTLVARRDDLARRADALAAG
jgi:hypothetical protein